MQVERIWKNDTYIANTKSYQKKLLGLRFSHNTHLSWTDEPTLSHSQTDLNIHVKYVCIVKKIRPNKLPINSIAWHEKYGHPVKGTYA